MVNFNHAALAAVRVETPILPKMLLRCRATVCSLMASRAAI